MSRNAVFSSWWAPKASYYRKMEKIPDDLGTAAQHSGDGVRQHGRHLGHGRRLHPRPGSGEKVFYGEFLVNAQGEDVVAGIRTPQPISELKDWNAGCLQPASSTSRSKLEKHYKDMQDFEFTVAGRHAVHAADPQRQAHGSGRGSQSRSRWWTKV